MQPQVMNRGVSDQLWAGGKNMIIGLGVCCDAEAVDGDELLGRISWSTHLKDVGGSLWD